MGPNEKKYQAFQTVCNPCLGGLIPLQAQSIEQAIALNGVAGQQNQQAFCSGGSSAETGTALEMQENP